ncbi:MaoC family dehydratase [Pseudonocardia yuanmonensis]|uniref:MaoC family dehydratase n=1 Tax=Pseudonocardia yuanmonensis TaxID=1095914 RepID=A0ABP8WKQ0_9PSEU
MGPLRPTTVEELRALVGVELGPTPWRTVSQGAIDAFARVTDDHQWIHVDPARAAASRFGSTIAHGLYTLSLGPALLGELMSFDGFAPTLNYGYEKVRFPAPSPVGSRVRMRAVIQSVDRVGADTAHVLTETIFESDAGQKPVCVAVQVSRFAESVLDMPGERS